MAVLESIRDPPALLLDAEFNSMVDPAVRGLIVLFYLPLECQTSCAFERQKRFGTGTLQGRANPCSFERSRRV